MAEHPGDSEHGPAMLAAIAKDEKAWSLDLLLDRNVAVKPITDGELMLAIRTLRAERAAIDVKQERAKARKDGVNDDGDETSTEA